ncbi:MAG: pentapeptide repeat-containing protein [Prevotella sp.]|nr:pentapeptide repeat-containing protein [Prevotella sp.]
MKQKILTFMVCLLAGITAIHAQTESESSIVSFIKTADDWKVLESMSVSDNKVVYTLKDGSQVAADVTHGQEAELPVYNAIYCVPGTLNTPLLAEYSQSGQLILMGTANQDDIDQTVYLDDSKKASFTSADFSHLDMSTVTGFRGFLQEYTNLKRVDFGGKIHSNVTDLYQMLVWCTNLEEADFSGCDFSGVTVYTNFLNNCPNLKTIKAIGCKDKTLEILRNALSNAGLSGQVEIVTTESTSTTTE